MCGGGVDICDEVVPFSVVTLCLKYPSNKYGFKTSTLSFKLQISQFTVCLAVEFMKVMLDVGRRFESDDRLELDDRISNWDDE